MATNEQEVFSWSIVNNIAVTMAIEGEIGDKIWTEFIEELQRHNIRYILALGFGKSEISATQRSAIANAMKNQNIQCSVVTDNSLTRGLVTAVSWLGANVRGHKWKSLDAAIAWLGVDEGSQLEVRQIALEFQNSMSSTS